MKRLINVSYPVLFFYAQKLCASFYYYTIPHPLNYRRDVFKFLIYSSIPFLLRFCSQVALRAVHPARKISLISIKIPGIV